jgi:hypothetical protein
MKKLLLWVIQQESHFFINDAYFSAKTMFFTKECKINLKLKLLYNYYFLTLQHALFIFAVSQNKKSTSDSTNLCVYTKCYSIDVSRRNIYDIIVNDPISEVNLEEFLIQNTFIHSHITIMEWIREQQQHKEENLKNVPS